MQSDKVPPIKFLGCETMTWTECSPPPPTCISFDFLPRSPPPGSRYTDDNLIPRSDMEYLANFLDDERRAWVPTRRWFLAIVLLSVGKFVENLPVGLERFTDGLRKFEDLLRWGKWTQVNRTDVLERLIFEKYRYLGKIYIRNVCWGIFYRYLFYCYINDIVWSSMDCTL